MAEKLSIQIALEGGKEIERQLANIGDAGKKAFGDIAKSAEQVGGFRNIKPEDVTKKLQDLGVTGVDAINKIQAAVRSAGRLEGLVQGVEAAQAAFLGLARVAGIASVAIVAAAVAATKATLGFANEINKASTEAIKLGLSFETFDRARLILEQMGAPANVINSGIAKLKENMDKLDVTRIEKIAENLERLQAKGVRFLPGAAPGLQELIDTAKGVGPAADAAREALARFAVGGAAALAQLRSAAQELGPAGDRARATLEKLKVAIDPAKVDPFVEALKKLGVEFGSVEQRLPQIIEALGKMAPGAERNATALAALGNELGTVVVQFLNAGGTVDQLKSKLGLLTTDQENDANRLVESVNRLKSAWDRFGTVAFAPLITTGINSVIDMLEKLQLAITNFSWKTLSDGAIQAFKVINGLTLQGMLLNLTQAILKWSGLGTEVITAQQRINEAFSALPAAANQATQAIDGLTNAVQNVPTAPINNLTQAIFTIPPGAAAAEASLRGIAIAAQIAGFGIERLMWLQRGREVDVWGTSAKTGVTGELLTEEERRRRGFPPSHASGGLLGGRGSGTSDSNLAWVSRGEHIMPARAVGQPGVLAFLEALRRSGGNLSRVLDGMGRFALGGMIRGPMPAFASGGLAGSMSNVTIQFPGLPAIGGLRASSDVVDQLHRAAALAQVRSGGRKPSRYS